VDGLKFKFVIQADALAHRNEGFIERPPAPDATGSISAWKTSIRESDRRQEAAEQDLEYRKMLQIWKKHGVMSTPATSLGPVRHARGRSCATSKS